MRRRSFAVAALIALAAAAASGAWLVRRDGGSDAGLSEFRAHRYAEALPTLLDAARDGDAEARPALGQMYANGWGVPRNVTREAKRWLDQAANQDNAVARCTLADLHRDGAFGQVNHAEALRDYRQAADAGQACGESGLGHMYLAGLGVTASYDESLRWYKKAAERGDAAARARLTEMQAGWVLSPLFTGPWRAVDGRERRAEIASIRPAGLLERVAATDVRRLRRLDVEFYEGASILSSK